MFNLDIKAKVHDQLSVGMGGLHLVDQLQPDLYRSPLSHGEPQLARTSI